MLQYFGFLEYERFDIGRCRLLYKWMDDVSKAPVVAESFRVLILEREIASSGLTMMAQAPEVAESPRMRSNSS